jgi:hypothetical protein
VEVSKRKRWRLALSNIFYVSSTCFHSFTEGAETVDVLLPSMLASFTAAAMVLRRPRSGPRFNCPDPKMSMIPEVLWNAEAEKWAKVQSIHNALPVGFAVGKDDKELNYHLCHATVQDMQNVHDNGIIVDGVTYYTDMLARRCVSIARVTGVS